MWETSGVFKIKLLISLQEDILMYLNPSTLMQLIRKSGLDLMQVSCSIPHLQTHYSHYEKQQTQYQFLKLAFSASALHRELRTRRP